MTPQRIDAWAKYSAWKNRAFQSLLEGLTRALRPPTRGRPWQSRSSKGSQAVARQGEGSPSRWKLAD